jgi:hypothetical protein
MVRNAANCKKREEKRNGRFKDAFLILDEDRAHQPQPDWPLERLRREAANQKFIFCGQKPKLEGLFLRMFPGCERQVLSATRLDAQLPNLWPDYKKPTDAQTLARKFTLDDLMRVANVEPDLMSMLSKIGFARN